MLRSDLAREIVSRFTDAELFEPRNSLFERFPVGMLLLAVAALLARIIACGSITKRRSWVSASVELYYLMSLSVHM